MATVNAAALALLRSGRELWRPRGDDEQPRFRLLLRSASTTSGVVERLARRRYPDGPVARSSARPSRGFVAGYNALPARTGRAHAARPALPRQGLGARRSPALDDVPALLPARPARQLRASFLDEHRRRRAAGRAATVAAAAAASLTPGRSRATLDRAGGWAPTLRHRLPTARATGRRCCSATRTSRGTARVRWYEFHLTIPGKLERHRRGAAGPPRGQPRLQPARGVERIRSRRRGASRRTELKLAPGNPTLVPRSTASTVTMRAHRARPVCSGGGTRAPHVLRDALGAGRSTFVGTPACTWTHRARLRARRRQRRQLPARQPVGSSTTGRSRSRGLARRVPQGPGQSRGSTRSRPTRAAARYYADDSRRPERRRGDLQQPLHRPTTRLRRCSVTQGVVLLDGVARARAAGSATATRVAPGIFAPEGAAAAVSGATTWRTRTTRTGCRARASALPASRAIIGAGGHAARPAHAARALQAEQRLAGTDGLGAGRLHARDAPEGRVHGNRNLSAELAKRRDRRRLPRERPRRSRARRATCSPPGTRRADVDSRGAVLWREYWRQVDATARGRVPFDANDPVDDAARLRRQRGDRADALTHGGQRPTRQGHPARRAARRQLQAEPRGSERIPIHGCTDDEGCFNIISTDRDEQGRYDPYTGSSFVMTAAFDNKGRPRGEAILTYSQSENPRSPHYADQTRLFSQEKWMPMRFTERVDPPRPRTTSGRW